MSVCCSARQDKRVLLWSKYLTTPGALRRWSDRESISALRHVETVYVEPEEAAASRSGQPGERRRCPYLVWIGAALPMCSVRAREMVVPTHGIEREGASRSRFDLCFGSPYYTDNLLCTERAMSQTTAVEFQRNFGEIQHQARREPVEITRHGRRELVLMSADHYDWLLAAARRTHRTTEAASVVVEAVRRAEMSAEHAHLDELLK